MSSLVSVDFEVFGHVQGVCFRMEGLAEQRREPQQPHHQGVLLQPEKHPAPGAVRLQHPLLTHLCQASCSRAPPTSLHATVSMCPSAGQTPAGCGFESPPPPL
ncbi:uncharacterized protein LOC128764537 isoform X1 [Synchiropus splendidus]|uniref:uncharacterized protein LOC128764537 isoform X1 n=1 Tax=Synchiropus splendidus TaxID=270530 RepID=UPI00237E9020|nr:uncharacterized protein LOC128764537 isoform X1 [Synchiropus splendidus]